MVISASAKRSAAVDAKIRNLEVGKNETNERT